MNPNNSIYYNNRGSSKYSLNEYKEAIKDYNKAIKLNPSNDIFYYNRGNSNYYLKNYKEAIKDYNEAIKLNPNSVIYYNKRGNSKYALNDYKEAIKDYNKAIELDPNNPTYYNNRGNSKYALNNYKEAIKDYNKAIELDPNDDYYNNRGIANRCLKNYEEAIKDYNKAIKLSPNNPTYYNNRGYSNHYLKNYEEAIKDYNKAIELNPNNPTYYNNRGNSNRYLKNYKEAIKDYNKAIKLNPNNAITYRYRAECKYMLENYKAALIDSNKALKLNNDNKIFLELKNKIEKAITENLKPEIKENNEIVTENLKPEIKENNEIATENLKPGIKENNEIAIENLKPGIKENNEIAIENLKPEIKENNEMSILYEKGFADYLNKDFPNAIINFNNFISKASTLNNKTNEIMNLLKNAKEYQELSEQEILKSEAYLTFADILGWKGIWQRENHVNGKKDNILKLIHIKNKLIDIQKQYIEKKDISIDINLISDTFVIGCNNLEIHNKLCAELITACLNKKLLIRGATAYGEYYNREMVYIGQAVDEAASWHEKGEEIGIFYTPSARLKLENKIKEELENKVKKDLEDETKNKLENKIKKEFLEEIGLLDNKITTKIGEINSYIIPWFKEEKNKNCFSQIMEKEIIYPEISKKYFNTEKTIKDYKNSFERKNDSK